MLTILKVMAHLNQFSFSLSVLLPLILLPLSLIYLLKQPLMISNLSSIKEGHLLFILIIAFITITPLLHLIFTENIIDNNGTSSHEYMITVTGIILPALMTGAAFAYFKNLSRFLILTLICTLITCTLYLVQTMNGGFFVDYYYLRSIRQDGIPINHLSLTESLIFLFFMVLAIVWNKNKIKWPILLFITFLFFSLGGRVAFFSFLATVITFEFLTSKLEATLYRLPLILIAPLLFFIIFQDDLADNAYYNKLFFASGLENDPSYQARLELSDSFRNGFIDQFLIGNINTIIETNGSVGSYAHNILSVFQFYGLIPFTIIIYTYYYIFKNFISLKLYLSNSNFQIFASIILIYSFLSFFIGKALIFTPIWLAVGYWLMKIPIDKTSRFKSLNRTNQI